MSSSESFYDEVVDAIVKGDYGMLASLFGEYFAYKEIYGDDAG